MAELRVPVGTRQRTYAVLIVPDGDGYSVFVPALPGCFSQGRTPEAAASNAREAIEVHIAGLEADGEPIPEDPGMMLRLVTA